RRRRRWTVTPEGSGQVYCAAKTGRARRRRRIARPGSIELVEKVRAVRPVVAGAAAGRRQRSSVVDFALRCAGLIATLSVVAEEEALARIHETGALVACDAVEVATGRAQERAGREAEVRARIAVRVGSVAVLADRVDHAVAARGNALRARDDGGNLGRLRVEICRHRRSRHVVRAGCDHLVFGVVPFLAERTRALAEVRRASFDDRRRFGLLAAREVRTGEFALPGLAFVLGARAGQRSARRERDDRESRRDGGRLDHSMGLHWLFSLGGRVPRPRGEGQRVLSMRTACPQEAQETLRRS